LNQFRNFYFIKTNPLRMRNLTVMLMAFLLLATQVWSQGRTITGRVQDASGNPLKGATVSAVGKGQVRTSTSDDGAFSLNVPAGVTALEVTFVGFKTSQIALGASNTVSVSLEAAASDLDAVVVTGYATKKKADFTGSVARVQAKEIEQVPIGSFEQILQGRAPGLYIASGSGQPGAAARVNIRGVGSINGGNDPLYILDGVPIESAVFRTLNPNDFATVDVLKDAAGAGLYGSRGANGVIVITSKKGAVGKMKFQYRGQAGYSEPPNQWNLSLMNTSE
jgi:TonB-dependent SusC/RagA subfamily outer membrane receptor